MNGAHIHLLLNHFPFIGLFFALFFLAFALVRRNETVLRAGLFLLLAAGLFTAPSYLSGEPAEEIVEKLPTFSEHLVEEHEEAAEFAIWAVGATALLSALALFLSLKKGSTPRSLAATVTAATLFSLIIIGRTNNLGGKISHSELRDGAPHSETSAPDEK